MNINFVKENNYFSNMCIALWMPMKHNVTGCAKQLLITLITLQFGCHRPTQFTFDTLQRFAIY